MSSSFETSFPAQQFGSDLLRPYPQQQQQQQGGGGVGGGGGSPGGQQQQLQGQQQQPQYQQNGGAGPSPGEDGLDFNFSNLSLNGNNGGGGGGGRGNGNGGGYAVANPASGVRRRGQCKFFNSQKGFGFLNDMRGDELGGQEVFCHYSAISGKGGFRSLAEGEEVEYEIVQGPKGYQATNLTGPGGRNVVGDLKARLAKPPPYMPFSGMSMPPYNDPYSQQQYGGAYGGLPYGQQVVYGNSGSQYGYQQQQQQQQQQGGNASGAGGPNTLMSGMSSPVATFPSTGAFGGIGAAYSNGGYGGQPQQQQQQQQRQEYRDQPRNSGEAARVGSISTTSPFGGAMNGGTLGAIGGGSGYGSFSAGSSGGASFGYPSGSAQPQSFSSLLPSNVTPAGPGSNDHARGGSIESAATFNASGAGGDSRSRTGTPYEQPRGPTPAVNGTAATTSIATPTSATVEATPADLLYTSAGNDFTSTSTTETA